MYIYKVQEPILYSSMKTRSYGVIIKQTQQI